MTHRTIQGRFLLSPSSPRVNEIILGCLARAQKHTDAVVHAVVVLANHYHMLATFLTVEQMGRFMHHFNCNVSKEIRKIHDWTGTLWDGRYDHIPVSDEPQAQLARLRYLFAQGCKEGLVLSPRDWPGVHCAAALADGHRLQGVWVDRTAWHAAVNRGQGISEADVSLAEEVELSPLPALAHLEADTRRRAIRAMVEEIEEETRAVHLRNGTRPKGARAVRRQDPYRFPKKLEKRIRPLFHAAGKAGREALLEGLRQFVRAYRDAARRLKSGEAVVQFPENCFPPGLPFVPPAVVP